MDPSARNAASRRVWPYAALTVAAAAAIFVALRAGDAPRYAPEWRSGKRPIPAEGQPAAVGCATQDLRAPRFTSGARFEIVYVPERATRAARASASIAGAAVPTEAGADGAVRIFATVGAGPLALEPGWHCLEARVGEQAIGAGFWVDPG